MVSQSLCLIYLEHDFFPFFSLLIQIFLSPYEEGPFSLYYISFFNKTNEELKKMDKKHETNEKEFPQTKPSICGKDKDKIKKREEEKITLVFHFVFLHFTVHHFLLSQAFFSPFFIFFLFRKEGRTESKRQNQSSLKEKVESFRADDYKGSHLTEICFCHQKNARHNDKRWSRKSAIFAFGSPFLTLFFSFNQILFSFRLFFFFLYLKFFSIIFFFSCCGGGSLFFVFPTFQCTPISSNFLFQISLFPLAFLTLLSLYIFLIFLLHFNILDSFFLFHYLCLSYNDLLSF